MGVLTVKTSPGAGKIAGTYSVTVPPSGNYPLIPFVAAPSGACGAGYQNAVYANGSIILLGADVAGSHLSINGGKSFAPVRDGQGDANKLRHSGIEYDPATRTFYVAYNGHDSGTQATSGASVRANGVLKATLSASNVLSPWSLLCLNPGAWASAQNNKQVGDNFATDSGHPRETGRMLALDTRNGLFYRPSWDGLWRFKNDGTAESRIWGAGNQMTAISLDPLDPTVAYVTVDVGPKVGVWKLTGINGNNVTEVGWTGKNVPYAQDVVAIKVGGKTHVFAATGGQVNGTDRGWAVGYLPPGANFTTGWRDITGVVGNDVNGAGKAFLSSGIDAIVTASGDVNLVVTRAWDKGDGSGSSVWYAFDWSLSGNPAWEAPTDANTITNLGGPGGTPWWFPAKQPTFQVHKPGFDCKAPRFATPSLIVLPGRSGVNAYNRTINKAYPICQGTQVTYAWDVLVHPTDPKKGIFCDTDWNTLRWSNGPWSPPLMGPGAFQNSPSNLVAWGGGYSTTGSAAVASGEGQDGSVCTSDDPTALNAVWVRQDNTGSNQPPKAQHRGAAMWGSNASNLVLLTAVQGSGVWRKVGSGASGAWTKVIDAAKAAGGNQTRVRFAISGNIAIASDQNAGVWRSIDKGATWTPIRTGGAGGILSGHVHEDKVTAGQFWLTANGKLWKITAAGNLVDASPPGANDITAIATYKKGSACWVSTIDDVTSKLRISPDGGTTWGPVKDLQSLKHATGGVIRAMNCTVEGVLLIACQAGYTQLLIDPDTAAI